MIATCPSREELEAFSFGRLPDDTIESIAEHLESCPTCEDTVGEFDDRSDTFLENLHGPPPEDPFADESACHEAAFVAKDMALGPSLAAQPPLEAGDESLGRIGDYRLLSKLGHGGMGTVYRALHTRMRRVVALKVLTSHRRHDPAVVERFRREMEAAGKLSHPNIVTAHDAGEEDGMHYLVMELVEGVDLHTLVSQHGPLPVADACEIIRQAALGLQHAHEHGLVHRDLKPSNLMVALMRKAEVGMRNGNDSDTSAFRTPPSAFVKILDLGLARLQSEQQQQEEEITATGQVMGTLDYMAPEQADDSHGVDIRSDIYGLGCTLYKLLTGHAPFSGESYNSIAKKLRGHAEDPPPPIRKARPEVPEALDSLIDGMLAKSPDDRPATPAAVAAALEPLCNGCDLPTLVAKVDVPDQHELHAASQAEIAMMLPKPSVPSRRRRLGIFAAVALLMIFVVAAAAIVISIRRGDGPSTAVAVPEGSEVAIDKDGRVEVTLPGEQSPVAGQAVDGLVVSFSVDSTQWKPGDEIKLTCSYKNESDEHVHVPYWGVTLPAMEVTRHVDTRIATDAVPAIEVKRQLQSPPAPGSVDRKRTKHMFVEVLPGQTVSVTRRGVLGKDGQLTIRWPNGAEQKWSLQNGRFRLQALLESRIDEKILAELAREGGIKNVWSGKALSGTVDVTVSSISRSPADAVAIEPMVSGMPPRFLGEKAPDEKDGQDGTKPRERGTAAVDDFLLPDPIVLDAYNTELPGDHRWFASGPLGLIWTEQGPVLASQRELGVGPVEVWYEDGEGWRRIGRTPYPAPNARFVPLSDDVGVLSNLSFGGRKISEALLRISGAGRFHELPGDGLPKHIVTGAGRTELPFSAGIEDIHWIWQYALVTDGDRVLQLRQVQDKPQTDEWTWPLFFCSNLCTRGSGDQRPGLGQGIVARAADGVAVPHFAERPPLLQLAPDHLVSFARDEKGRPLVLRTTDGGKTWSQTPIELRDPIYPEDADRKVSLAAVRLHDGSLTLVFRTSIPKPDPPPGSGLVPTHTTRYFLTISADEGRTWQPGIAIEEEQDDTRGTEPVRIAAAGRTIVVSHAVPVRFPVLNTISVSVSTDTGKTWQRVPLEGRFDGDLQLNELAVSPDGTRVLLAANHYDPEDNKHRHQLIVQEIAPEALESAEAEQDEE